MLKIAICDDNYEICSNIERMILDIQKNYETKFSIEIFYSGESLLDFIKREHAFDIIFLDIELGTTTGIKVATAIREEFDDHISKIVFITAKDGYETRLFDIQPLNFIKKPIDKAKVHKCIDLALKLLQMENSVFQYKKDYNINKVRVKDIVYFEKVGRKTKIVMTDREDSFNETISKVNERLPKNFVETHCSYTVNFDKIVKLNAHYVVMTNDKQIPISQRNLKTIRQMLMDNEME